MTTIARSRSPQSEVLTRPITTETVHYQVVHWIRVAFGFAFLGWALMLNMGHGCSTLWAVYPQ